MSVRFIEIVSAVLICFLFLSVYTKTKYDWKVVLKIRFSVESNVWLFPIFNYFAVVQAQPVNPVGSIAFHPKFFKALSWVEDSSKSKSGSLNYH